MEDIDLEAELMKTEIGARVVGFKQKSFATNRLDTSRYTLLNFVPLTLFAQFNCKIFSSRRWESYTGC